MFAGWSAAKGSKPAEPLWVQVGGSKDNHVEPMDEWFEIDPRFQMALHGMLAHGTNLVITDQPVNTASRSNPGFSVMMGKKEEDAAKEDQVPKNPKK